jgi:DNA-binding LacI/PurR family transcriptional regulator
VATIRDVAERAQVSTATVSRVLNDQPSVNRAIRAAVLKAIDELQFQPNAIARTLRTAKTRTLALLVSGMRNADLLAQVLQGAESAAQEQGYELLVGNTRRDPAIEQRHLKSLVARRVSGILFAPVMPLDAVAAFAERSRIPMVVYGRTAPTDGLPHTVLRFTRATEEAIGHLLALGHRRIGTVTYSSEKGLDARFGWGASFIRQALRARGIEPDPACHLVVDSSDECTRSVCRLFTARPAPTALFITNLFLAPPTLAGIRAAGARVPDDVSLIGCGDSEWAQFVEPPLSVVAADLNAHLADSTRMLVNLIDGDDRLPVAVEHHARYIRRLSVEPPRAGVTATHVVSPAIAGTDAAK